MSIEQTIWSLDTGKELQPDQLNSEWTVIGRQVHTVSGGFIDLLCIDRACDLTVVELKRSLTPREVIAQALDYASCVSDYGYADAQLIFTKYTAEGQSGKTLGEVFQQRYKDTLDEENFNSNPVQIVIVASQMDDSTERIVTYLKSKYSVPINILFFKVYSFEGKRFISRAWYLERIAAPASSAVSPSGDWNGEFYVSFGTSNEGRSWEDAQNYGFISAGGGEWYSQTLSMLFIGDRVWVNIPHTGYVGVGRVTVPVVMAKILCSV